MAQYRAVVGIDYPPNKRVEAGDIVSDLPGDSIKWLLEQGLIESPDKKTTVKEVAPVVVEEEPLTKIDLSDGLSPEEEKIILETAETIEGEDK
jgi:hypothetical protein